MAVRLSALRAGRCLPPGRFLVLIRGWVDPRAIVRLEGLGWLKNPFKSSGIEPVTFRFVAVPQPTTLPTCIHCFNNKFPLAIAYKNITQRYAQTQASCIIFPYYWCSSFNTYLFTICIMTSTKDYDHTKDLFHIKITTCEALPKGCHLDVVGGPSTPHDPESHAGGSLNSWQGHPSR
jgi:hypothetical protein